MFLCAMEEAGQGDQLRCTESQRLRETSDVGCMHRPGHCLTFLENFDPACISAIDHGWEIALSVVIHSGSHCAHIEHDRPGARLLAWCSINMDDGRSSNCPATRAFLKDFWK